MRVKKLKPQFELTFFSPDWQQTEERPFVAGGIAAGFPSPADDFAELRISLDQTLVKHKEATFYAKVKGNSMIDAGIHDGDILVIDRSLEPANNKIAVCYLDGAFTVKRIVLQKDGLYLMPENNHFAPIKITEENELVVWGIVTYVIKGV
jgi:DNA polymerase V